MFTWSSFALVNLILYWKSILKAKPDEIKSIAKDQDSSQVIISITVIIACLVSLFTVIFLFKTSSSGKIGSYYSNIFFSIFSIALSWILIHTIFTIRYAHKYYAGITKKEAGNANKPGLQFPDDDEPDYFDFAYFSFVIGMTFQVSDIVITSSHFRRMVLLHGLLSFGYSTVIVAFAINILAGLMQK
jgi:uncharacterized membrane protein